MYYYNVARKLERIILFDWLKWMQQIHILQVKQTGCFTSNKLLRLLETDEANGFTYIVQYMADSIGA